MSRESLDYKHNPQFTDEIAASIVINDTTYVMLLTHAKFKQFTPKEIANPTKVCGVPLSLSWENRSAVKWGIDHEHAQSDLTTRRKPNSATH